MSASDARSISVTMSVAVDLDDAVARPVSTPPSSRSTAAVATSAASPASATGSGGAAGGAGVSAAGGRSVHRADGTVPSDAGRHLRTSDRAMTLLVEVPARALAVYAHPDDPEVAVRRHAGPLGRRTAPRCASSS